VEYIRITSIDDPLFAAMHQLLGQVFPAEEVLAFEAWAEPLRDPSLRVCVAVKEGEVVGATEYRYLPALQVAMIDFTIIKRTGLGVGRFLWQKRTEDLRQMAEEAGGKMLGTFAEIYNPERVTDLAFGGFPAMHPVVRREVLSHMGFQRLDFPYVHPSWQDDGTPVTNLDFCFLPADPAMTELPATLVADFLTTYYQVLPNKPAAWHAMIDDLRRRQTVALRPL
jgi:hypothetical protein